METLIGVVIDMSYCMEENSLKISNIKNSDWINSLFTVVNDLIDHNVSRSHYIFTIGFGAKSNPNAFDILNTIKNKYCPCATGSKREKLDAILDILESGGAPILDRADYIDELDKAVEHPDASLFLDKLLSDEEFKNVFLGSLPSVVDRNLGLVKWNVFNSLYLNYQKAIGFAKKWWSSEQQVSMTRQVINDLVTKAKELLDDSPLVSIGSASVLDVHIASTILKNCMGGTSLTKERIEELSEKARPYIAGSAQLNTSLASALKLFSNADFNAIEKLLIIVSAGKPSDVFDPQLSRTLTDLGVKTVCCYVTKNHTVNPRQLYSTMQSDWDESAKLMFNLSSSIPTQTIPCTLFLNRGWAVALENNETRLFFHVNHPDIMKDACNFAREILFSQEALSSVLASVSLDLYINKAITKFTSKTQQGGTCYANAAATVMHLSMTRIFERKGGCPNFFSLREEIIKQYGNKGASTFKVLKAVCPKYRLRCQTVNVRRAMKAIVLKRPVVAIYYLTDTEWDIFSDFFAKNPKGILSKSDLDLHTTRERTNLTGHAVVLTSYNTNGLRFMNSWGSEWADAGFFMIKSSEVLDLKFIDVFWKSDDLEDSEKDAWKLHGTEVARKFISKLKGLHEDFYKCPICIEYSKITEFKGHHLKPICPKCRHKFEANKAGDSLALHLYLLSISLPVCDNTKALVPVGGTAY